MLALPQAGPSCCVLRSACGRRTFVGASEGYCTCPPLAKSGRNAGADGCCSCAGFRVQGAGSRGCRSAARSLQEHTTSCRNAGADGCCSCAGFKLYGSGFRDWGLQVRRQEPHNELQACRCCQPGTLAAHRAVMPLARRRRRAGGRLPQAVTLAAAAARPATICTTGTDGCARQGASHATARAPVVLLTTGGAAEHRSLSHDVLVRCGALPVCAPGGRLWRYSAPVAAPVLLPLHLHASQQALDPRLPKRTWEPGMTEAAPFLSAPLGGGPCVISRAASLWLYSSATSAGVWLSCASAVPQHSMAQLVCRPRGGCPLSAHPSSCPALRLEHPPLRRASATGSPPRQNPGLQTP